MEKYTANYANTNPNFVIQNLNEREIELPEKPLLYVLKNILQRGCPTTMSQYLQERLGKIHQEDDFEKPFVFISPQTPQWHTTIKGDEQNQYFPARDFFEDFIPRHFGAYTFVQALILPEVEINKITGEYNQTFVNQQVDFYLPQAKLVIEIDGQQHKKDDVNRINDGIRDKYLRSKGVHTIRITTRELRNNTFHPKIDEILQQLQRSNKSLKWYKTAYQKVDNDDITEREIAKKIKPSAIIRFQILILELLLRGHLNFEDEWKINLMVKDEELLSDFADLAVEDLFIWLDHLHRLKEKEACPKPNYSIKYVYSADDFDTSEGTINVDFSLFQRWTDEPLLYPDMIYVRTDYFGAKKNYFSVSRTNPISYRITDEDHGILTFFLRNLFDKEKFRDGQLPIITGGLNREDTIGLLPTGGGKSLCYQLPSLLQPSINFVVCPIKSLMYDQHENMKEAYITHTNFITSDQDAAEKSRVQQEFGEGKYLFVWISPERFQIKTFREYLAQVVSKSPIAYAVIDEVHCLSEWGHDFRTSYLNLSKTIQRFCPKVSFVGLTATASVNVLKDIRVEFSRNDRPLENEKIKSLRDYSRKELVFDVIEAGKNKFKNLSDIISEKGILEQTEKAALIFTPHVNGHFGCHGLANKLNSQFGLAERVKWYSGEVPKVDTLDERGRKTGAKQPVMDSNKFKEYKKQVQLDFKKGEYNVLSATKAFGMGIDKQNIHYTIHYGIPSSVEALYQEAGRAGRWDPSNLKMKNKKANCYVLYSKETTDPKNVEKLFEKDTTFTEIKDINEEVGWGGKDIFRQIFLFLQGQKDSAQEFEVIKLLLDNYFVEASQQKIFFNTITGELLRLGFSGSADNLIDLAQKGIYRLSVLGIVRDWTTDFTNHYEVEFVTLDEDHVKKSLFSFLTKYQPDLDLDAELERLNRPTLLDKCIWYLLQWTFENIAYNRKQSLKTLADWCNDFEEIGNEAFKRRLDNYFRFTDTTFLFQHIAEHPLDYMEWFEVFYLVKQDDEDKDKEYKIFIPEIEDEEKRIAEFEKLRDGLSRFLESYRNNIGLNMISGLVRLFLDDYEDTDGRNRMEGALSAIVDIFKEGEQLEIIDNLLRLGNYLTINNKENLCLSIVEYYPEELERIADYYGLFYLLDDTISEKVNRLKQLNQMLYGELEQIGKV